MKNLIFALFFWLLLLLAMNGIQNNMLNKRVYELENNKRDLDLEIYKLKREIEYIKNPYSETI